jgi:hypothetical protein
MANELVTVYSSFSVEEAHVIKNRLEAEGIKAYLADEITTGFVWHLGNAIGGVKVQVAEPDAERAASILESTGERDELPPADHYLPTTEESECGEEIKLRQEDAGPQEEDAASESPGDALVTRAWRAAIIGLVLFPPMLHLFSLYQLSKLENPDKELSPSAQRLMTITQIIDWSVIILVFALFLGIRWILSRLWSVSW